MSSNNMPDNYDYGPDLQNGRFVVSRFSQKKAIGLSAIYEYCCDIFFEFEYIFLSNEINGFQ